MKLAFLIFICHNFPSNIFVKCTVRHRSPMLLWHFALRLFIDFRLFQFTWKIWLFLVCSVAANSKPRIYWNITKQMQYGENQSRKAFGIFSLGRNTHLQKEKQKCFFYRHRTYLVIIFLNTDLDSIIRHIFFYLVKYTKKH